MPGTLIDVLDGQCWFQSLHEKNLFGEFARANMCCVEVVEGGRNRLLTGVEDPKIS